MYNRISKKIENNKIQIIRTYSLKRAVSFVLIFFFYRIAGGSLESRSNRSRTRRQGERDHTAVRDRQPDEKRGQRHRGGQLCGLPEEPDTGGPLAGRGGGIGGGRRTNIRQGSGRHPGSPDGVAQDHVQPGSDGVREYKPGAVQSGSSRRTYYFLFFSLLF